MGEHIAVERTVEPIDLDSPLNGPRLADDAFPVVGRASASIHRGCVNNAAPIVLRWTDQDNEISALYLAAN